jgi:hypothetical protein
MIRGLKYYIKNQKGDIAIWWKLKLEILRHEQGIVSNFPIVIPQ